MDFPESMCESDLLSRRDALTAKKNDLMVKPSVVDFLEEVIGKVAKINAGDFSSQCPRDGMRFNVCIIHVCQRCNFPKGTG